jgi:diacylglycerol kinase (ATP)
LTLDATPLTGDFLLLEVLNTPCIGPNLVLAPDANPSDGFFSVVTAEEEHREALSNHLRHRLEGRDVHLARPIRLARQIELEAGTTSIGIEPAALYFLAAGIDDTFKRRQ